MSQPLQSQARLDVSRKVWSCAAAIAVTAGLLVGCSAASPSVAAPTNGGPGPTAQAPGSTIPSSDTAAGSPSLHSLYCNAIKLPDAQVLFKDPITADQFDPADMSAPFDCTLVTAAQDSLVVSIDTADAFDRWVTEENAGTGTALTGVGDKAVWVQDPTLANPPIVVAIKGSVTCRVTAPETEKTTIDFKAPNGVDQVSPAAAASFAKKMAVLCTDAFSASS